MACKNKQDVGRSENDKRSAKQSKKKIYIYIYSFNSERQKAYGI